MSEDLIHFYAQHDPNVSAIYRILRVQLVSFVVLPNLLYLCNQNLHCCICLIMNNKPFMDGLNQLNCF